MLVILKIAGLLDVKVNCPGTEGVTVGGVRTKVPEPTVFAGMVIVDRETCAGPEFRFDKAETFTVAVTVAVSNRVKSVGVNSAVTLEVPAASAVALSPLVICKIFGALELKVNAPGTADPTVGATILKIGSPTVLFGIVKAERVGTVFPESATTTTVADARDCWLIPAEL